MIAGNLPTTEEQSAGRREATQECLLVRGNNREQAVEPPGGRRTAKKRCYQRVEVTMMIGSAHRALAVGVLLVCAQGALAAGPEREGTFDAMSCYAGPVQIIADASGQLGMSYDVVGTEIRKPGELGYLASTRCVGSFVRAGGESIDSGLCVVSDPDGDRYFRAYSWKGQSTGTWKAVGGTGKYEGIEASGTYSGVIRPPKPVRPDVLQVCNQEAGRWKLR
jgi:hypothetical protein